MDAAVLAELRRRYAEPHRAWHDWARIAEMLAQAEEVVGGIAHRTAFILAILFHNAVFDPKASDNAARSAALMRRMLGATTPPRTLARAEALILVTGRQESPRTADISLRGDAMLLLDSDLSILGAPTARYQAYEVALRREYAHLRDDAWRAGRSSELQMLLWRERIYGTDRFYLEFEKRARRNIESTIDQLDAS